VIVARLLYIFGVLITVGSVVVAPVFACLVVAAFDGYDGSPISAADDGFTDEGATIWIVSCVAVALVGPLVGVGMIVGGLVLRQKAVRRRALAAAQGHHR
jgi:hypothetical protein